MSLNYTIKYFHHQENNSLLSQLQTFLDNNKFVKNDTNFEYLFIIGGDGTFLNFVNQYVNKDIKVIMINAGNIGFFSSCSIEDLNEHIFNDNLYQPFEVLKVNIDNKDYFVINEITTFSFNALPISLKLNNQDWYQFHGSGFITSTPLGSSGSNKSNFGPLVDPSISCYIFSEILTVNNARFKTMGSPIVLSSDKVLELTWDKSKNMQIALDNKIIEYKCPKIILSCQQTKAKLLVVNNVMISKWKESFIK